MAYLTLNDLKDVYMELIRVSHSWYNIGLYLDLKPEVLDKIRSQYAKPAECLLEILKVWLTENRSPTWEALIHAIDSRIVKEHELAGRLAERFGVPAEHMYSQRGRLEFLQNPVFHLNLDDLNFIYDGLFHLQRQWYNIGLQLGQHPEILDDIRHQHDDTSECLLEMLKQWLKCDATNRELDRALRSSTVNAHSQALLMAKRLAENKRRQQYETSLQCSRYVKDMPIPSVTPPSTSVKHPAPSSVTPPSTSVKHPAPTSVTPPSTSVKHPAPSSVTPPSTSVKHPAPSSVTPPSTSVKHPAPTSVTPPSTSVKHPAPTSVTPPSTGMSDEKPSLVEIISFPGENETFSIPERIGTNYSDFGILLLEDKTGARVDGIVKENRENAKSINRDILVKWLWGQGRQPVTWRTLIEVLRDAGLPALADDIEILKCS